MSSPYQRNGKNQDQTPLPTSNTDKNIKSNLEDLRKLKRDDPFNPLNGYLDISFERNRKVQLTDICKKIFV